MWGHDDANAWGMMGFGMISIALFWIVLIIALIFLVKKLWDDNQTSRHEVDKAALVMLKARYARGEISKAEFEQQKRAMSSQLKT